MNRTAIKSLAEIESYVCGIPCIIAVTDYEPYLPASTFGSVEKSYPAEGGYGEYVVLDRKGYRALWLERKITRRIDSSIQNLIFSHFEE